MSSFIMMGHQSLLHDRKARDALCLIQQTRPAPLISTSYFAGGEDYYRSVEYFLKANPSLQDNARVATKEEMNDTLVETLAVNLSVAKENGRLCDYDDLISEFALIGNVICRECMHGASLMQLEQGQPNKTLNPEIYSQKQLMLLCHPVQHLFFDGEPPMNNAADLSARFFAFLWYRGVLTEEQVRGRESVGLDRDRILRQKDEIAHLCKTQEIYFI